MVARSFANSLDRSWVGRSRRAIAQLSALLTTLAASFGGLAAPGLAAETIRLEYGPLSRSVSIASLEHFAATGTANGPLECSNSSILSSGRG